MIRFRSFLLPLISCALLSTACMRLEPPQPGKELVVAMRNTPAFFQEDEEGPHGFHYDLAKEFADSLGMSLRIVVAKDGKELAEMVRDGRVHFAAAIPNQNNMESVRFTAPLRKSNLFLVHHADHIVTGGFSDLSRQTVEVTANSPLIGILNQLAPEKRPKIIETQSSDEMALLEQVAERKSALIAMDSAHFDIAQNFYPDLRIAVELPVNLSFSWAFTVNEKQNELYDKAQQFIAKVRKEETLANIEDRYFGHINRLNEAGISQFLADMRTKLPKYQRDFEIGQELTGIDWRLIAALAYQESKWEPLATSPTGVRGMMMLTEDTADQLNVTNRLDAKECIRAGSLYLAELSDSLPETVNEPDRTWLALAAYNLGMGHLNGARAIASGLSRDPDSWYEMKTVLPLLSRPQYYARLKSGRARGGEAVIMVENIRNFYDILSRFKPAYKPPLRNTDLAPYLNSLPPAI